MKNQLTINPLDLSKEIRQKLITVRGELVLVDRDVAALYGVETKALNQAVKRNLERFPQGYVFQLDDREFVNWKSQIVTSNLSKDDEAAIKMGIRRAPYAFTEKGLYMLATVLKSDRAIQATHAIIETYAQVRAMGAFGSIKSRWLSCLRCRNRMFRC